MSKGSFRESYAVLQRHSDTLRQQREPNIDDLLNIVTESVAAYKVCKSRIEAVEKALAQALGQAEGGQAAAQAADGASAAPAPAWASAPASTSASAPKNANLEAIDDDGDVPF